ncbi:MAG: hypothetical protein ACI87J_002321 [Colwellia sp.]|jgi:hypothetical protein
MLLLYFYVVKTYKVGLIESIMEKKFIVDDCGSVELCVGESVDILKKVQGKGWVVERKLFNMMSLMSGTNKPSRYDTLLQLEIARPEWGGVILSLFDETEVISH